MLEGPNLSKQFLYFIKSYSTPIGRISKFMDNYKVQFTFKYSIILLLLIFSIELLDQVGFSAGDLFIRSQGNPL